MELCLTAIVRNEAPIIARMLRSVRPFISSYSISDTGSTDNTKEIILRELEGIPGVLESDEWVDFATNRNIALSRATGSHVITIDADETISGSLEDIPDVDTIALRIVGQNIEHWSTRIVRNDEWKWVGAVHEIPNHITPAMPFGGLEIQSFQDGHQTVTGNKFEGHLPILERAERTPRNVFYHARTLFALERFKEAIPIFEERVRLGGWEEEVYYSLFQIALAKQQLHYPIVEIVKAFFRAHEYRPSRPEPYIVLSSLLRHAGNYALAAKLLSEFPGVCYDTLLTDPRGAQRVRMEQYLCARQLGQIK